MPITHTHTHIYICYLGKFWVIQNEDVLNSVSRGDCWGETKLSNDPFCLLMHGDTSRRGCRNWTAKTKMNFKFAVCFWGKTTLAQSKEAALNCLEFSQGRKDTAFWHLSVWICIVWWEEHFPDRVSRKGMTNDQSVPSSSCVTSATFLGPVVATAILGSASQDRVGSCLRHHVVHADRLWRWILAGAVERRFWTNSYFE